ncbi:MAG: hypothetical protein IJI19_09650 [Ruminococcus sp.]|nr:hypothetical protein [Ruminococcus sp.]
MDISVTFLGIIERQNRNPIFKTEIIHLSGRLPQDRQQWRKAEKYCAICADTQKKAPSNEGAFEL